MRGLILTALLGVLAAPVSAANFSGKWAMEILDRPDRTVQVTLILNNGGGRELRRQQALGKHLVLRYTGDVGKTEDVLQIAVGHVDETVTADQVQALHIGISIRGIRDGITIRVTRTLHQHRGRSGR